MKTGYSILKMQDEKEIRDLVRQMFDAELYSMERNESLKEPAEFSGAFKKRMEGLIRRQRQGYKIRTAARYALSAAAVLLIIFCLTNPGRVAKAWNALVRWYRYSGHTELHMHIPEKEEGRTIPEYELTYIPEGFHTGLDEYDGTEGVIHYFGDTYIPYGDSMSRQVILLAYSSSDAHAYYQDVDAASWEKDEEGNDIFVLKEADGGIRLVWYSEEDELTFLLYGNDRTEEEMFRIKDGIRKKADSGRGMDTEAGNQEKVTESSIKEQKETRTKGETSDIPQKEAKWEVTSSYTEKVNDMLSFDADVIVEDSFQKGIFYKTEGYYQEYDTDAFRKLFFEDKRIKDRYTYEMPDRSGKKKEGYVYYSDDGCSLCLYPTDAVYSVDAEQDYYFYGFCDIVGNREMYNADKYSLTGELDFMTRKEAERKVLGTLEKIGLSLEKYVYQAYALDAPTLSEESRRAYGWGFQEGEVDFRTEWEADQEAYAFRIWQVCQGLPVWTTEIGPLHIADESQAPVSGIYRKDGFVRLYVADILKFETVEEYDVLLSFDEMVKEISEKCAADMKEDSIVIKEMRLCALAIREESGKCTLKPVWICTGELTENRNLIQMTFDAVTGDEIYRN